MNRRNFIGGILAAGAGFMILPGAARKWKRTSTMWIPNPEWETAQFEVQFITYCEYPWKEFPQPMRCNWSDSGYVFVQEMCEYNNLMGLPPAD